MSPTLLGWLLILSSIVIAAPHIFALRSSGARRRAAAARLTLLSRLRLSSKRIGRSLRGRAGTLIAATAVSILVAGVGAVTSYIAGPRETTGRGNTASVSLWHSRLDGETLARLEDYTRSIGNEEPAPTAAAAEMLPDVDTMIERLEVRLATTPENIDGWRMLGWSYFNTGRYEKAARAYARALELDPSSAELKLSYEGASAMASESNNPETALFMQMGKGAKETTKSGSMPARERDVQIRSMVDGLADRLEGSPRDVEGWTRLMRSRVSLGESEVAATAFRKALEVFKDEPDASDKITATAIELGLKAE